MMRNQIEQATKQIAGNDKNKCLCPVSSQRLQPECSMRENSPTFASALILLALKSLALKSLALKSLALKSLGDSENKTLQRQTVQSLLLRLP
jgi:hypothetical protein